MKLETILCQVLVILIADSLSQEERSDDALKGKKAILKK